MIKTEREEFRWKTRLEIFIQRLNFICLWFYKYLWNLLPVNPQGMRNKEAKYWIFIVFLMLCIALRPSLRLDALLALQLRLVDIHESLSIQNNFSTMEFIKHWNIRRYERTIAKDPRKEIISCTNHRQLPIINE